MVLLVFYGVILTAVILLVLYLFDILRAGQSLKGRHVLITGGSSGIGKSIAISAARRGAHVTIVARNLQRLEDAKKEIVQAAVDQSQSIMVLSLDIAKDYVEVEKTLTDLEVKAGPVYMLVNCAGGAACGRLEDISSTEIQNQISMNVLGTLYVTKALISSMKSRGEGSVVVTGSQSSLVGIYGYSIYSSTKFALRGFAEALHMEVKPYGLSVTLAVPPDTDTPGFANEEKSKPMETRLISQTAGLFHPDVVGEQIVNDALKGKFFSYVGFESLMACLVCAGMSPLSSPLQLLLEAMFMSPLRLVSAGYLIYFNGLVQKCKFTRNKSKKVE